MKKECNNYVSPTVESIGVAIELGFAQTGFIEDAVDNDFGTWS